jgi:Zn-dependent protease with chaperone function
MRYLRRFILTQNSVSDAAASVFNVLNDYVAQRAYSRKLEEEADALGLQVCRVTHALSIELGP